MGFVLLASRLCEKLAGFSLSGKGCYGGRRDAAASSDFQMGYQLIGSGLIYSSYRKSY
jgi:hypothetical protein